MCASRHTVILRAFRLSCLTSLDGGLGNCVFDENISSTIVPLQGFPKEYQETAASSLRINTSSATNGPPKYTGIPVKSHSSSSRY